MARDARPVRIALRARRPLDPAAVADLAESAVERVPGLAGPVRVRGLHGGAEGRDWMLRVEAAHPIGAPEYASAAWDLAHRLRDSDAFALAEADVPVAAFARDLPAGAVDGGPDCADPSAAAHGWALRVIGWQAAMDLMDPAVRGGAGIRIGHPDSGYSDHFALGPVVDTTADWDLIDNDDDATDPLTPPRRTFANPLPNPGHGTSTASIILGAGDREGFHGVAPRAVLVPYRATESVVQVFDSDVAESVRRAHGAGCHVVSMSLGGTGFFGLREAIQAAVDDGMIVMAAAGNQVGVVTAPAAYDNCLAVAATGPGDVPWSGSSRGSAVDVAAPGSCVWTAAFDWAATPPGRVVRRSHGTSFAVAHLAGVAALWLAHHGHQALCDRFSRPGVQAAFLHLLRAPGVSVRPPGWDDDWGAGRVDARALLAAGLPEPAVVLGGAGVRAGGGGEDPVELLAALTGASPARVREWLTATLGAADRKARTERFAGELAHLLLTDRAFRESLTMPGLRALRAGPPVAASPQLRSILVR